MNARVFLLVLVTAAFMAVWDADRPAATQPAMTSKQKQMNDVQPNQGAVATSATVTRVALILAPKVLQSETWQAISGNGDACLQSRLFTKRRTGVQCVVFAEDLVEVIDAKEVVEVIVRCPAHFAGFDHFEDNITEVCGRCYAPIPKDGDAEHSKMLQCQFTQPVQKLRPADVARDLRSPIAAQLFLCKPQRGVYKLECVWVVGTGPGMAGGGAHSKRPERRGCRKSSFLNSCEPF